MFEMMGLFLASVIFGVLAQIPGFLPRATTYFRVGWAAAQIAGVATWQAVRNRAAAAFNPIRLIIQWAVAGSLAWLIALALVIYWGNPVFTAIVFGLNILVLAYVMVALAAVIPVVDGLLARVETLAQLGRKVPLIANDLHWTARMLIGLIYGPYLLVALPIRAAAEIALLATSLRGAITNALKTAITVFAGVSIILWFLTAVAVFEHQHGVHILSLYLLFGIIGTGIVLATGSVINGHFGGPKVFIGLLKGLVLVVIGVIVWTSISPRSTREIALHLENAARHSYVSSQIVRQVDEIPGEIFGHTTSQSIIMSCDDCRFDKNDNFVGKVGESQILPAGTYLRYAGDDTHPVPKYGVLWVRVHKGIDNNPRLYNMDQVYLVYKDDLIMDKRPTPNADAAGPQYPRWFLPVIFLVAVLTILSLAKKRWFLAAMGIAALIWMAPTDKVSPAQPGSGYVGTNVARAAGSVYVPPPPTVMTFSVKNSRTENLFLRWKSQTANERFGPILPTDLWDQPSKLLAGTWSVENQAGDVFKTFPAPLNPVVFTINQEDEAVSM